MKKILSILGEITLIGTSTTSLVACDNIHEYTQKELADLKEKNNIKINSDILEWIAPKEKLTTLGDKYYFVVWRGNKNDDWRIVNFKHSGGQKIIDKYDKYELVSSNDDKNLFNLFILTGIATYFWIQKDDGTRFKAVYRWDGVGEPNLPEIDKNGNITNWNLENQNNIINNDDEIKVTVINNDISENPIYQLEANYFNWLSITNELETNNIPSLIPAEIKLSDGEYGKYLTSLIVSNDKIEDYLNHFSQWYTLLYSKASWINMVNNLVEDNIKITFLKHEKLFNLSQIEISGMWGYGNYAIRIFIEKTNEKIIEEKDINLELIKSTSIGTKVSGKDRNTYLQLIEFDVWYLWKNGVEDEKSYSNKAVFDFLKQSNSLFFSYPPIKEQININKLELFNKNNDKLSLITLEI